jgi:hypothetical protein
MDSYRMQRVSGAATTTFKTGAGKLGYINLCTPITGGTLTVYDNTTGSGTVIALITSGATGSAGENFMFHGSFQTGLTIVSAGVGIDFTVSFY